MTRFLFTMNMPSGNGRSAVHQVVGDHPAADCRELAEVMADDLFIIIRQFYFEDDYRTGERLWTDRGDVVLNTAHIGKVAVHYTPDTRGARPGIARDD